MKKLFWMMLAALPMQAMANGDDPIAYKCYYCTPAEMEDVALAQGVGRHYVYDAKKWTIFGYDVLSAGGELTATQFPAESWVQTQFRGMLAKFNNSTGEMVIKVDSYLYAPDTEHGRFNRYIWGHHVSSLNPHHERVRETLQRFLRDHEYMQFLDTSNSGGRLLRFEYMVAGDRPILAEVEYIDPDYGTSSFFFDHDSRQWRYLSSDTRAYYSIVPVQETRDDFAREQGTKLHSYRRGQQELARAFVERARWASIPVHGSVPISGDVSIRCERSGEDIQCYIE